MESSISLLTSFSLLSLFTLIMLIFFWIQTDRSSVYSPVSSKRGYSSLSSVTLNHKPNSALTPISSNVSYVSTHSSSVHSKAQQTIPSVPVHTPTNTFILPSHYWRNIDNSKNVQLKLFSAYYDDRDSPEVYLLGFENHDANQTYYCVFRYENEKSTCLDELAIRTLVNYDVDTNKAYNIAFWGFYYICKLPTSEVPVSASLSLSSNCTLNSDEDWLPVEPQIKRDPTQMKKFGVCVQGPIYNVDDPKRVVEFIELHKALGAEIITVYVQTAGELVWKALEQYRKEGLVDLVNWNLTFIEGSGYVHYRGQSLLVNECIYRNMYRVQYLAMNDLDEVFVPQGNFQTWSDMLPSLEGQNRGAFLFSHTTFTGDVQPIKEDLLQCRPEIGSSLKAIQPPRYITRNNRFQKGGYEKFMVKPMYSKKASFHHVFVFVGKYYIYHVPQSIGISYHYREPPFPTQGRSRVDNSYRLNVLFPSVLEKIREQLCALYTE